MNEQKNRRDVTVGILMIAAGIVIFLYSIDILRFAYISGSLWAVLGVTGLVVAVNGWRSQSSFLLFLGGFLLVAGTHTALWSFGVLETTLEGILPAILLWIGLASLFVWLPTPYKIDLLIPALLFGGSGLGYYLWWWDIFRLSELKDLYADSWPLFLILLGGGILLRSLKRTRRKTSSA
jgi:hypothetical protein